jgi:hypothetical protein
VQPGLYAVGDPGPESPVVVTANYTLSFDSVRRALAGHDTYILVLDTKGINVWCAAGKGTFGTDELVHRISVVDLDKVVSHRSLVLPQLGATGVAAHEVKRRSGFAVRYGPVRASDIPAYLATREATPAMRQVRFDWLDRVVLVPVEVANTLAPLAVAAAVAFWLFGPRAALATAVSVWAGVILFPLVLPWLPTADLTIKGWILGTLVMLPFAWANVPRELTAPWAQFAAFASTMLAPPVVTAYIALNFTGSTTYTSWTGVRKEINRYTRWLAGAFACGIVANLGFVTRQMGVWR